jgi:3-oxoacyl-[acyl-carrier protein] reductase
MTTAQTTASSTSHGTGRIVVITGAAGGVGAALAERFLANGDRVIATDISADALDGLRSRLGAGDDLITVAGSIADEHDVQTLADTARVEGRVDVLLTSPASSPSTTSPTPPLSAGAASSTPTSPATSSSPTPSCP